jgi:hypothetical protein
VELGSIAGQGDGGLHAEAVRVGDLEAEFSRIALREERQSQQHDSEMNQPAQGLRSGGILMIPARYTKSGLPRASGADGGLCSRLFTKYRHGSDKPGRTVGQVLTRSLGGRTSLPPASRDRRLQAFRHREGMGKNWRSYRRGCERRFVFWSIRPSRRCLPRYWPGETPRFWTLFNCYNFGELDRTTDSSFLRFTQASE